MKKEDIQNSQYGADSAENKGESRDQQKNRTTNLSGNQLDDMANQAGLGRDRINDIEDLGDMSGKDDYAGGDNDDISGENTNESTNR